MPQVEYVNFETNHSYDIYRVGCFVKTGDLSKPSLS
jgi:hypothetical protein